MKVTDKNTNTKKLGKLWAFPKKLNSFAIGLIIIAYIVIASLIVTACSTDKHLNVYPDYEEMQYSEELNTFIKYYSNYSVNDEDELIKKDTFILCFYGTDNNTNQNIVANSSALTVSGDIKHYDTKKYESQSKTGTTYVLTSKTGEEEIDKFFVSGNFKSQNNEADERTAFKFAEEVLKLSKNDKQSERKNEIVFEKFNFNTVEDGKDVVKESRIFDAFAVRVAKTSDEKILNFSVNYTISSNASSKYHFDMQMYIETEDEVLPLIGYYNLSNRTLKSYSHSNITVPASLNAEYVYVKVKFIDANEDVHTLLYKEKISNLLAE